MAHSVTYSPDGEVLSVTVHEPRFTQGEKALLLAARRKALEPRGPHGHLLSEAMDVKNQFAYEAVGPVMDWVQKTLDDAEADYRKRNPNAGAAAHFRVVRRSVE